MTQLTQSRLTKFENSQVRISSVLDIASAIASDLLDRSSLPDELEDLLGIDDEHQHESVKPIVKALINAQSEDAGDILAEVPIHGILLEVHTPIQRRVGEAVASSWSSCWYGYVYAETYEQALELAIEWAAAQHKSDLAAPKEGA